MASETTVLVVGAGPTGLLAAAELCRRGVDCLLIDAHEQPMGWDRATVVHPRSLEMFDALGIVEPFLAAGVRQKRAVIHADGAVLGAIDLALCGSRYPFNIGISEEVTERILTDYLARQGGAVTRATTLVGLEPRENAVLATVEHAGVRRDVLAGWVVGCDGHHSAVRTLAGIGEDGHDIAEPWAVFDAGVAGWPHSFEGNYGYLDRIPVIMTALPDERWRVYLRPASQGSDLVEDAASTLSRYLPTVRFDAVANPTRFHCHTKVARRYRAGRILIAGDAAHTCSPAQGHGMNSGLQDAFNLAWKLALVCQGHCSDALLDSYEAERRPVAQTITASGDAAESAQMMPDPDDRAARDAAIREAFADPETLHAEAVAEAELDIDYRVSPIVMGNAHEAVWPGVRLPDWIEVRHATEGPGRLHDHARGPGHAAFLIGGASTPPEMLASTLAELNQSADTAFVESMMVVASNPAGPADILIEPETARRLGADGVTLLVVRADGHVGLRADAGHAGALAAYLGRLRTGRG